MLGFPHTVLIDDALPSTLITISVHKCVEMELLAQTICII